MRCAVLADGPVRTLADGIAVKRVGETTFPIIQRLVDEVVSVGEDEIAAAVLMLLEKSKIIVEGAGAATLELVQSRLHRLQVTRQLSQHIRGQPEELGDEVAG